MADYKTHNDLSANAKAVSIGILNARLADSIDLALLTKQAHWNLKGPRFIAIHEMLDGFRDQIDEYTDTREEAIINSVLRKDQESYRSLLSRAFKECKRVLKQGGWLTIVFHNSSQSVWAALEHAIWARVRSLYGLQGTVSSCKSQGGAVCFAGQLSRTMLTFTRPPIGMLFIRVTSTRK